MAERTEYREGPIVNAPEKNGAVVDVEEIIEAVEDMVSRFAYDGLLWLESAELLRREPLLMARYMQRAMNVGNLMINAAKCHNCGDTIASVTHHDFSSCSCRNVSVDGGTRYCRRVLADGAEYTDLSRNWPWVESDA
jgi:hypothetical protein